MRTMERDREVGEGFSGKAGLQVGSMRRAGPRRQEEQSWGPGTSMSKGPGAGGGLAHELGKGLEGGCQGR